MINVALLGCGRWGRNHLKVLASLRDRGLVSHITVVDISKDARDSATLADETRSSMENVVADFVVVATPSNLHSEQSQELISNGYHVLAVSYTHLTLPTICSV